MNECVDLQGSGKPELIHPKRFSFSFSFAFFFFFLQLSGIFNDKGKNMCYHVKWEKKQLGEIQLLLPLK